MIGHKVTATAGRFVDKLREKAGGASGFLNHSSQTKKSPVARALSFRMLEYDSDEICGGLKAGRNLRVYRLEFLSLSTVSLSVLISFFQTLTVSFSVLAPSLTE